MVPRSRLFPLLLCGSALIAAPATFPPKTTGAASAAVTQKTRKPHLTRKAAPEEAPSAARTVEYHHGDVVEIHLRRRSMTTVQIHGETAMRAETGDRQWWQVEADRDSGVVFVRPKNTASKDAASDMTVTTTAGNVYLFTLRQGSPHDVAIEVVPADKEMAAAASAPPKFVDAVLLDGVKAELADARKETDRVRADGEAKLAEAQKRADAEIEAFRAGYPGKLDFGYRWKKKSRPFNVISVWNDGTFTFVKCDRPHEVAAIYALKEKKKPYVLDAAFKDGLYTIPSVVDDTFYLQIGNRKFTIKRTE